MVAVIGEAAVRLRPNTSGFSESASIGLMGPLKEVAKKGAELFAISWGAEKTFDYLKESVHAYSDTTEATTRAQTVFGSSFEQVQKFAEGAARSMGQSTAQAIGSASTFGNLFRSMGITNQKSADMSTSFVRLASDMASFNNVPIDQAIGALQSGVTGMTRPLRQFGVNITAAQIQTEAATLGFHKQGKAFDSAAIAQASYALIMKQTALTQGDFTRTSHNLADQQRILKAETENLKDRVGSAIYPFVDLAARGITGGLLPALLKIAAPLEKVGEAGAKMGEHFAELGKTIHETYQGGEADTTTFVGRLGSELGKSASDAVGYWTTLTDAAKGGGVGMLATEPTLSGFLARFGDQLHGLSRDATSAWMTVRTSAMQQLGPLDKELAPVLASVKATFTSAFSGLFSGAAGGAGTGIIAPITKALNAVTPLITGIIGKVGPAIQSFLPVIANVVGQIVPIIMNLVRTVVPLLMQIIPIIQQVAGIWQTILMTAIKALLPILPVIVSALGQLISTLASGLGPIISALGPIIHTLIGALTGVVTKVIGALLPVLPPLIQALLTVGQTIVKALLQVLQALMPVLPPIVAAVGQVAQVLAGALGQALMSLAPVLSTIINALLQLVMTALQPLLPILPTIAGLLVPIANLFGAVIQALAPLLPLAAQIVGLLVQLLVVALQPLMPIITILANLIGILVQVLVPIITIGADVISVLVRIAAVIISTVVGAISGVIGWFQHMLASLSGIFSRIGTAFSSAFSGIQSTIAGIFNGVVGIVKGAINTVIGVINGAIHFINDKLIGTINHLPGVSIPNIPDIPKLHVGGVFMSGSPSGEGLALLRDREVVVTPEQRDTASGLLAALTGSTPSATSAALGGTGGGVTVQNNITQQPGESGTELAARVTQGTVWNLNNGITRTVGAPAGAPA